MIHWNVNPEIFRIGFVAVRWYSLLFMLAFVAGIYIMNKIYKLENKPVEAVDPLLMYMLFATVIGARLGHCLFYDPAYYLSNPVKILMVWEGGLASHGAAIGILTGLYLYSRKYKDQPFLWLVDRVVIPVALAGAFIRTGNLFNSEIIGAPTDLPWAFVFDRVDQVPRHPSQIYEALAYLFIFVILYRLYMKQKENTPKGQLLGLFLILVFGFRFFVEFVKANQEAFEQGMTLNMGQILSIPAVLAGVWLLYRVKKNKKRGTVR